MAVDKAVKLGFMLSATDKMSEKKGIKAIIIE